MIAERMRCPVVSDFRPADVAAGGEGAPLVPMLDFCLFRSAKVGRVLLNLGGIANLTAIPAGAGLEDVVAFDTGPGNMVVNHCMATLYGKKYDRGGRWLGGDGCCTGWWSGRCGSGTSRRCRRSRAGGRSLARGLRRG